MPSITFARLPTLPAQAVQFADRHDGQNHLLDREEHSRTGRIAPFRDPLVIAALVALALAVRLTYQREAIADHPIRADAAKYYLAAFNLTHHGFYSTEWRGSEPPQTGTTLARGYPLFLVPFFPGSTTTDDLFRRVTSIQATLGALTVALTYVLARTGLGVAGSLGPSVLAALSPHLVVYDAALLSETLFTALSLAGVLVFVLCWRRGPALGMLGAGLLLGAASATREIGLLLGPVLALLLPRPPGRSARGRLLLAFGAGVLMVLLADRAFLRVMTRGRPVEVVNSFWTQFVWGSFIGHPNDADPLLGRMAGDRAYGLRTMRERFARDPWRHLRWYLGGKVTRAWRWEDTYTGDVYVYPVRPAFHENALLHAVYVAVRTLHWPAFWLALAFPVLLLGYPPARSLTAAFLPVVVTLAYYAVLLTILLPEPRYSVPLRPYVYVLAAATGTLGVRFVREPYKLRRAFRGSGVGA